MSPQFVAALPSFGGEPPAIGDDGRWSQLDQRTPKLSPIRNQEFYSRRGFQTRSAHFFATGYRRVPSIASNH